MKTYGLIGYPLSHSFSQQYFSRKFTEEKIDARYLLFPIPSIGDFHELLDKQNKQSHIENQMMEL